MSDGQSVIPANDGACARSVRQDFRSSLCARFEPVALNRMSSTKHRLATIHDESQLHTRIARFGAAGGGEWARFDCQRFGCACVATARKPNSEEAIKIDQRVLSRGNSPTANPGSGSRKTVGEIGASLGGIFGGFEVSGGLFPKNHPSSGGA
eukprot:4225046-Amphidinium_carterae.1